MNEYEQKEETQPLSKINSAFLINLRMDAILKDAHRHSRDGKYLKWNDDIDRLWLEVAADVAEGSTEEEKYKKLSLAFGVARGIMAPKAKGFETTTKEVKADLTKQKLALLEKELFVRRLINKQGKGTAYQDNSDDYMDN